MNDNNETPALHLVERSSIRGCGMIKLESREEAHFSLKVGGGEMKFIMRPMSVAAEEGTIAFLDGHDDKGRPKREVATFKDGEWRGGKGGARLRITPLCWTTFAPREASPNAG